MQRIDTATKSVDLFGAGKHGFTAGNQQGGVPPTQFSAAWANAVQESIARTVEIVHALDTYGNMDLARSVHMQILQRKPRSEIPLDRWATFQTHEDSGTPGTWRRYERTMVKSHQADNQIVTLATGLSHPDFPNNSRMWIEVHAMCVEDVSIDIFHGVVMRGTAKKTAAGFQDINMTTLNTDNDGGLTVAWVLSAASQGLAVNASIPIFIASFFNILVDVQIRAVSLT